MHILADDSISFVCIRGQSEQELKSLMEQIYTDKNIKIFSKEILEWENKTVTEYFGNCEDRVKQNLSIVGMASYDYFYMKPMDLTEIEKIKLFIALCIECNNLTICIDQSNFNGISKEYILGYFLNIKKITKNYKAKIVILLPYNIYSEFVFPNCEVYLSSTGEAHIYGFKHIELRIDNVEKDSPIFNEAFLRDINILKSKYNLSVSIHLREGLNLAEETPRLRQFLKKIILEQLRVGDFIGAKWATIHPGKCCFGDADSDKKQNSVRLVADLISQVIAECEMNGVNCIIAIENLPMKYEQDGKCNIGDSLTELLQIKDLVLSDNMRILFDVGHILLNDCTSKDFLKFDKKYLKSIIAWHFHWNDFKDDIHRPIEKQDLLKYGHLIDKFTELSSETKYIVLEIEIEEAYKTRELLKAK